MAENDIKLPDTSKLVVSSSPHFHGKEDVAWIMRAVVLALLPACLAGVWFFGLRALLVLAVCGGSCVAFEHLFARMLGKRSTVGDFSALLTGLLLGMNLAAGTPIWVCVVGSLLAIGLGKMIYGGLGYNPFNPALIGRVGLLIACPVALTTWVKPNGPGMWARNVDALTGPTPLGVLGKVKTWSAVQDLAQQGKFTLSYADWFIGRMGGCIGETCAVALLVGGIVLIYLKIIRWQIPVAFIGTVLVLTGIMHMASPGTFAPPAFHLFTGGLFLGAFFMATDMVTSPMSKSGAVIFGIGCGLLTSVIRIWGSYPEGVSFSILIMNALTPLIDRLTPGRPFGFEKKKESRAE